MWLTDIITLKFYLLVLFIAVDKLCIISSLRLNDPMAV